MAFNCLKDDLGECPVYEIRGVDKEESTDDQEEKPMTGVTLVPEFDGSPQKSPINGELSEHCYVPYNQANEGAVNRAECSLNATDLLSSMTVPVYAWFRGYWEKSLTRVGGSRLKGVNTLKSSEDLWGPIRWHSRLDPFPYSEPLTNLTSYFCVRGISDEQTNEIEPEPIKYVPSGVAKLYGPNCRLSSGPACALLDHAAWELPLLVYDPRVEGRRVARV
ncbi:hypothetical protein CRG98_007761 [Punica granatum]|uniref:Uncharacterized protein n=1 Tax=Punica granatum TaxID=22663 RepID=A0A2I0KTN5_PUNGR|nr:hypothetical protein CRG98_007761 [Punica granatum]